MCFEQAAKASAAPEDQEDEEGGSSAHASYNYLLSMAIYNLTWEKVHQLEQEAEFQVCMCVRAHAEGGMCGCCTTSTAAPQNLGINRELYAFTRLRTRTQQL